MFRAMPWRRHCGAMLIVAAVAGEGALFVHASCCLARSALEIHTVAATREKKRAQRYLPGAFAAVRRHEYAQTLRQVDRALCRRLAPG